MTDYMLDDPVVTIHLPPRLRGFTQGADEATASGQTVGEVLSSLDRSHPGVLAEILSADGALRPGFEVFLGGTPIRELDGLDTPVGFEELVAIVPASLPGPTATP